MLVTRSQPGSHTQRYLEVRQEGGKVVAACELGLIGTGEPVLTPLRQPQPHVRSEHFRSDLASLLGCKEGPFLPQCLHQWISAFLRFRPVTQFLMLC